MLITENKGQKDGYKYKCDRCGQLITMYDRKTVVIESTYMPRKRIADLCPRCINALIRGINKGKK